MIRIMAIQFIGPIKIAILSTGSSVEIDKIKGNAMTGSYLKLEDGVYRVGAGAEEACEV